MIIVLWPLLLAILGVLVFALSTNGKISELGKWLFIVSIFWVVYALSGKTIHIG